MKSFRLAIKHPQTNFRLPNHQFHLQFGYYHHLHWTIDRKPCCLIRRWRWNTFLRRCREFHHWLAV